MSIARMVEVSAQSTVSFEDAIKQGIAAASDAAEEGYTVANAWVKDQKVCVDSGKITEYRVHLKVACVLSTGSLKAAKTKAKKS